jgi:hypothetical protein
MTFFFLQYVSKVQNKAGTVKRTVVDGRCLHTDSFTRQLPVWTAGDRQQGQSATIGKACRRPSARTVDNHRQGLPTIIGKAGW